MIFFFRKKMEIHSTPSSSELEKFLEKVDGEVLKKTEELSKLICEEFNIEKNGPDYNEKFEFVFTNIFDQKIQLLEKIVVE